MINTTNTVWFTIVAKNYLAYAITLYRSFKQHHPDARFIVFLADEPSEELDLEALPFPVIAARDLPIPTFGDMTLRYNVMELATAIKPSCFQSLLNEENCHYAIYLDPDIWVQAPLDPVLEALNTGANLVLTPHIRQPFPDNHHPDDQQILNVGTYNLGFAAMADSADGRSLLDWWHSKLVAHGHNDLARGQFVDQKYMDLAPSFVPTCKILYDPGLNAAYWNLHERPVTHEQGQWLAGGVPLRFFHFSGSVPGDDTIFSKHQSRYGIDDIGDLRVLLRTYLTALAANRQETFSQLPYTYDYWATGEQITQDMRRAYADHHDADESVSSPSHHSFDASLYTKRHDDDPLPTLLMNLWQARPDLQKAYPLATREGKKGVVHWFKDQGASEFNLPPSLVEALTAPASNKSVTRTTISEADETDHQDSASGLKTMPAKVAGKIAGRILNASPSLRPAYSKLPLGLRSMVKTALYRTHAGAAVSVSDTDGGETGTNEENTAQNDLKMTDATGVLSPDRETGVHLYGYVNSNSGIGQGARGLARALKTTPIPLAISALSNPDDLREDFIFKPIKPPRKGFNVALIDANPEQVLHLEELVNPRKFDDVYRIGYWVWELPTIPEVWIPALNRVDEIWVPSTYVAAAFRRTTEKTVTIIPHVVEDETPTPIGREHFGLPEGRCVFLASFDVNSFIKRKNPVAAIQAFRKAFETEPADNGPILAIKVHGSRGNSEARRILEAQVAGASDIIILDQTMDRGEYLALHNAVDAYLSLHRAEGFGLNLAEAMVIGKPVIATNYSGNCDFMTPENSVPIPYTLIDIESGAYPHSDGLQWADPDENATIHALRHIASDLDSRVRLGRNARATILNQCSANAIGQKIADRMKAIDPSWKPTA